MQAIKHLFFTYRNGAVADTLRRYGTPHRMIFGLDVPRIAEIARGLTPSMELADRLWDDSDVRESRLLATYLFPVDEITEDKAVRLSSECRTQEEADMLAFRLLKRLPYATTLLTRLQSASDCARAATALANHLS